MAYHLSGALNGALFVLALVGLALQIARIWGRRATRRALPRGEVTALLSLNYFSVSYLAYLSFFVYGFSISPFNHYLVWPRLLGCVLVLVVLFEIARDRSNRISVSAAGIAAVLLIAGLALLASGVSVGAPARVGPQLLALVATVLISQSLIHQIVVVRRAGRTGAVAWPLHFLTLMKDLSTVLFGFSMGLETGWPLIVMGGASSVLKLVLLWQLYRAGLVERFAPE
ncbi:MAG: hypothetical protein E2O73_15985 [Deltaproteobacteria bacterium]|nr:MAG: hypothetical protein E2O73_15985 [Deltaproteobacteria bacterium]